MSAPRLSRTASLLTAFMVLNSADKAESLVFYFRYRVETPPRPPRREARRKLGRFPFTRHAGAAHDRNSFVLGKPSTPRETRHARRRNLQGQTRSASGSDLTQRTFGESFE